MALSVVFDTLSRAQIIETPNLRRVVRTGYVKGLTTLAVPAAEVYAAVTSAPGMPAYGDACPAAAYADCKLSQRLFDTIEGNPDKVPFTLVYENTTLGLAPRPVTFVLSRRTVMALDETEVDPATLQPLTVTWVNQDNPNDVEQRTRPIRYRRPHQVLVADGYYVGEPPSDMLGALGTVNESVWRGLPAGYWFYADQSDVTRDYGGSYNIQLQLETRLTRDWSEWKVIGNARGRVLKVDPAAIGALAALPYLYGVRTANGVLRCGPYPTADFDGVFGFGGIS